MEGDKEPGEKIEEGSEKQSREKEHHEHEESRENTHKSEEKISGTTDEGVSNLTIGLIVVVALLIVFNQYQFYSISKSIGGSIIGGGTVKRLSVSNVELSSITSTAQAVNTLFPVEEIETTQDAINMMIPTGTPEYGPAFGVSYDDPVNALNLLAKQYKTIKNDIKNNDPEVWQRYLNLATKPVGISCEFCCGVGPVGITKSGELRCGCKHNPGIQAMTLLLMKNTDYSDSEILKEDMKWKSVWFPRNMIDLTMKVAGGDSAVLKDLPGMVGGC